MTSAPAEMPKRDDPPAGAATLDHRGHEVFAERVKDNGGLELGQWSARSSGPATTALSAPCSRIACDLGIRARLAPDGGARGVGQRDDHAPHSARGAQHQHPILGGDPGQLAHHVQRRQAGDPHRRGLPRLRRPRGAGPPPPGERWPPEPRRRRGSYPGPRRRPARRGRRRGPARLAAERTRQRPVGVDATFGDVAIDRVHAAELELTRTSPAAGSGSATVSTTSGSPWRCRRAARTESEPEGIGTPFSARPHDLQPRAEGAAAVAAAAPSCALAHAVSTGGVRAGRSTSCPSPDPRTPDNPGWRPDRCRTGRPVRSR